MSGTTNKPFYTLSQKIIDNGYNVIPIKKNSKQPVFKDWSHLVSSKSIKKWLKNKELHDCGVGINTKFNPCVDIDILDAGIVAEMLSMIESILPNALERVGLAPKTLLICATQSPFTKIMSKRYKDEFGNIHRVEILGDGQQAVIYNIHPDTKKPYSWPALDTPVNTPVSELPELSIKIAKRIIKFFEDIAERENWIPVNETSLTKITHVGDIDLDDPFASDVPKINIDPHELKERLLTIPDNESYETWINVGMALYHQFGGHSSGLELWDEWSQSAENYEIDACDKKWSTFNILDKGRSPVTARYILKLAIEVAENNESKLFMELSDHLREVNDIKSWKTIAKKIRDTELPSLLRSTLVDIGKKSYARVSGASVPIETVRKELSFRKNIETMPDWCDNWVFDSEDDKFFNTDTKIIVSKTGFDSKFNRKVLLNKDVEDGKSSPKTNASDLALNVYKIPIVHGRVYAPGKDDVFINDGTKVANTYPENSIPELPDELRPRDLNNIKRIESHINHLLEDEREQRLFLSWLAYVVQNPGKRVNWAVVLQGTEGDGKSFFAFLLRAVMGVPNVKMLNGSSFKSDFTGWAEGQCVIAVEELRLQGELKYEIVNKIKPFITNDVVEVHAKGKTQRSVTNTTNYLMFTNYRDALPVNDNDRRFFILFSKWQDRQPLSEFKDKNPNYYDKLYKALDDSAPALRKWLLDMELDREFKARGDAPRTMAHNIMVKESLPEEIKLIFELIQAGEHPDISEHLLNITKLRLEFNDADCQIPNTRRLSKLLSHAGFYPLDGRVKVGDTLCRFYSKTPHQFTVNGAATGECDQTKIVTYLKSKGYDDGIIEGEFTDVDFDDNVDEL